MSRLDSFIERMQAQRALLTRICADLNKAGNTFPGPAIELGLGNGRTYDHLRRHLEGRRIVVFDRSVKANPDSVPPADDLFIGEIDKTGPAFVSQFGRIGAVLHADLGNGVAADDLKLQAWLPDVAAALVRQDAWVVTSTRLDHPALMEQDPPPEVRRGKPYHVYRRA